MVKSADELVDQVKTNVKAPVTQFLFDPSRNSSIHFQIDRSERIQRDFIRCQMSTTHSSEIFQFSAFQSINWSSKSRDEIETSNFAIDRNERSPRVPSSPWLFGNVRTALRQWAYISCGTCVRNRINLSRGNYKEPYIRQPA